MGVLIQIIKLFEYGQSRILKNTSYHINHVRVLVHKIFNHSFSSFFFHISNSRNLRTEKDNRRDIKNVILKGSKTVWTTYFNTKRQNIPKWKRGKWLIKNSKVFDEDWFIFIVLSYLLNAAKLFLQKKEAEKNAWYTSLYKKNKKNKCRRKEQKWGKVKSDNDISQTHLQDKQNYRSKLKGKIAVSHIIGVLISAFHHYSLCGTLFLYSSSNMSSAVGLNLLPPPISTTTNNTTVTSAHHSTKNETIDKTKLEVNEAMKHGNDKNISKSPELENSQEDESDSNHNSEPNEGTYS